MVAQDAEAGHELVTAQRELNSQLNNRRSAIDVGRDRLEQERRQWSPLPLLHLADYFVRPESENLAILFADRHVIE